MSVLKLRPSCKDYLWGGRRLIEEYGKECDKEVLAETWELSCHPDGPSTIANGEYAGKILQQYIDIKGKEVLGTNCRRFRDFPILTKLIDAKDNLSIQVHPDNRYALKNEGQYGKTEMWYVMDAGEHAFLYYGFKREVSMEEFEERIRQDTLLEVLHAVPVQKGDVLFIESGTIHAIGKDILIAEIQQNSNVTYRVYDYGRVGKDGKKRDLHIEKALAVTKRVPISKDKSSYPHIADCDYFTVDKLNLDGKVMKKMEGNVLETSFASILILDGEGTITSGQETVHYRKGDSFFLPAGSGAYTVEGSCDALITTIREKAAPVRIGIDIGVTQTQIGLVDVHQKLLACKTMNTEPTRPAEEVIRKIAQKTLALLEEQKISAAGAGRDCQDVVMMTLGVGVGGGIILDGEIYAKKSIGGSEIGHMVIVEDGEPCTCGRQGCLEAYVSVRALIRDALRVTGEELTPKEIFERAAAGDTRLKKLVSHYVKRLGIGIVNVVNIFRPQLVLLGGELSPLLEPLLPELQEQMKKSCFGGADSECPVIEIAALGNQAGVIGAASLI